ncbi:MAG: hypothetical protein ACREP7_21160, partial [Lysobacter sp.]
GVLGRGKANLPWPFFFKEGNRIEGVQRSDASLLRPLKKSDALLLPPLKKGAATARRTRGICFCFCLWVNCQKVRRLPIEAKANPP